ncbi:MAG: ABC transporter substrate-binding protein [Spirochaetaceae bacterium]|nr:MAG: ABC transporter substrate-binding protein [Spirochaetaceae bacterium]
MKRFTLLLLAVFVVLSAAIAFAGGGKEAPSGTLKAADFTPDTSLVSGKVVLAAGGSPKRGGTLEMALPAITHLDPVSIAGDTEPYVFIFETLFEFDAEWKPTPLLVESFDVSADGKVHTWRLRKGIKFHDGSPFNAEVVKWNIDRKIAQNTPYATSIPWADNPIKVIDEYTVTATLKEPSFVMYNYLTGSSYMMYSKKFVESVTADDLKNKGVGTGPYIIKEYLPNDHLYLERNPDYWQKGLPFFDAINIQIIPDANTRLLTLEAGQIDFVKDLSIQDIKRLEGNSDIEIREAPSTRTYHIPPHSKRPPFDNVNVRRALNYAVDKEAMNKTIYEGKYLISRGISTPLVQGFQESEPYTYNPEKAKQMLTEAGLVDSNGDGYREWQGKEREFILFTRAGQRAGDIEIAEQFQAFMAEVGLKIKIEIIDAGQYFTILNQPFGQAPYYDLTNQAPSNFIADMSYPLDTMYSSWSWPGNFYNYAHYANEKVDELIKSGNRAGSLEARNKFYAEAQNIVWNEAASVFLFDGILTLGTSRNVRGVFSDGAHNVWNIKYGWFAE